ncbi:hypothetical protein [Prosthecobacter dejongeii]|uniref:Prefoldin subunit 5 n=1 Tax=Prosthecobacter dejongeii TaxID=48465 RepID=A0A7W7YPA7_9BACT|nr:hypothetical protein [Prosthecobacter dejongeii]MBB5039834.1 prefoldin subunit 5 [Prosthecobacter dejongeii]
MPELNPAIETITEAWAASLPILQANSSIVESVAPGCSVEQCDEAVQTILKWASSNRAPHGFRPIYPIVRLQLASSLTGLSQHAQNLKGNPAAHFPAFFTQLLQCIAPITAACTFSDKAESHKSIGELGGELSQHISLMHTAQGELGKKMALLEKSEATAALVDERASAVETAATEIETAVAKLAEQSASASTHLEEIEEGHTEIEALKNRLDGLIKQNETLQSQLQEQAKHAQDIANKADQQQKLLDELLPRGTSAGLASAFNQQRTRFGWSQTGWAAVFLGSVITLIVFAWSIKLGLPTSTPSEIWSYLLFRIPLASPLIWLGWFSAIQYGNVLRLKEDYAFKEATSMAFAGYRDHMEHLREVDDSDAGNALNKLALVTISILGNDPLRLLQGQSADASPLDKISTLLRAQPKPTKAE